MCPGPLPESPPSLSSSVLSSEQQEAGGGVGEGELRIGSPSCLGHWVVGSPPSVPALTLPGKFSAAEFLVNMCTSMFVCFIAFHVHLDSSYF